MASDLPAALNLNDRQAEFVRLYVEFGNMQKAAEAAGYAESHIACYRLMKHPVILAAIRYETAKRVQSLAPAALTVLEEVMRDTAVNPKTRAYCAVQLLDRAGHNVPTAKDKPGDKPDRPLAELSVEELEAMIHTLRKSQAEEAELVQAEAETAHNAPVDAPKSEKAIDMFE